jgi:hypothetical protein
MRGTLAARFAAKVHTEPNTGCWLWGGALSPKGYGQIRDENGASGKVVDAHRVSVLLHRGAIPSDLSVLHRCDVRHCVNPDHLFLGTHEDNMADMARKGRASRQRGEDRPGVKLTDAAVKAIRERRARGTTAKRLAAEHGVSLGLIYHVITGRRWTHLGGPLTTIKHKETT